MIRFQEFPDGYNHISSNNSPGVKSSAYAHVFTKRMAPVWDAYDEFDVQTLEAEALWGGTIRERTDALRALVRKLSAAAEAYIANEASGRQNFEEDREFGKQIRSELFASPSQKDNELTNAIEAAVKDIESELRPHLRQA